jgi:hypothetical protein
VLWYEELDSTLQSMGFANNPYNVYARSMTTYLLTSNSKKVLENISDNLICKYEAAPSQVSIQHNFLGIDRDLSVLGDVTRSMKGFVNNIITKYKVHSKCHAPAIYFTDAVYCLLLPWGKKKAYHSCVMMVNYLAKRSLDHRRLILHI